MCAGVFQRCLPGYLCSGTAVSSYPYSQWLRVLCAAAAVMMTAALPDISGKAPEIESRLFERKITRCMFSEE